MIHSLEYLLYELRTDDRLLERFKWLGNISVYAGAVAVSTSIAFAQQAWPFMLYFVGNIVWLIAALTMKDKPLFWMNLFLTGLNSYAIWIRV